jgi:hypothetical protein
MNETTRFKEDCFKHFNHKYEQAVKEINNKHNNFDKLQQQIWSMKNHISILEYTLMNGDTLPTDYEVITGVGRKD